MKTVKVSKKYRLVIPKKLHVEAKIKPGDKMLAIAKRGILQYIPIPDLEKTKGMMQGLDIKRLRDETERI